MSALTALGLAAGALTTVAFLPQVTRVWHRRSAADLSYPTLVMLSAGVGMWLVYAVLDSDLPMMIANGLTVVLTLLLVVMKLRFDGRSGASLRWGRYAARSRRAKRL